jgi:predicted Abi (CAAX) family protease
MVQVNFTQPYSVQPIVTISPMDFVDAMYRVADVTTSGFTIQLNQSQSGDRLFSWHAFGGEGAKVYVSDGTSSTLQMIEAPTPSLAPVLAPTPAPSEVTLPEPVIEQTSSTSSTPSESTVMSENTSSTESVTP